MLSKVFLHLASLRIDEVRLDGSILPGAGNSLKYALRTVSDRRNGKLRLGDIPHLKEVNHHILCRTGGLCRQCESHFRYCEEIPLIVKIVYFLPFGPFRQSFVNPFHLFFGREISGNHQVILLYCESATLLQVGKKGDKRVCASHKSFVATITIDGITEHSCGGNAGCFAIARL